MKKSKKRANKDTAVKLYKEKWGLTEYDFWIRPHVFNSSDAHVCVIHKNVTVNSSKSKLINLNSILKWLRINTKIGRGIEVCESNTNRFIIKTMDEFKKYFMTKKLANIS